MARRTWFHFEELRRIVRRASGATPGNYNPARVTVNARGLVTDAQEGDKSANTTKGDITTHDGSSDVRLAVGTDGQQLVADSGEASGLAWAAATKRHWSGYDSAGGVDVRPAAGGPKTVLINTKFTESAGDFSLATGELTVNFDGTLLVSYDATFTHVGGTQTGVDCYLELDTGSGFAEITGTRSESYHRTASRDTTQSGTCMVVVSNGDKIRLRAVEAGICTVSCLSMANRSRLTCMEV